MTTETHTVSQPEISVIQRLSAIPLASWSLSTLHTHLSENAYTKSPYSTATSAYNKLASSPTYTKLVGSPLVAKADGYANKGLDAVQSRYPYPFEAKPDDVASYVRERRVSAGKAIDERVKSPAVHVAQGIDQRFAPIVDYFEVAVNKLNHSEAETPAESSTSQYQYQRAYRLSQSLYTYSNDQLKALQAQSTLVQRASETAAHISALAHSSQDRVAALAHSSQERVHALSNTMLAELSTLQSSLTHTSQSFSSSLSSFSDTASSELRSEITSIHEILSSEKPLGDKAKLIVGEVRERVSPLLSKVSEIVGRGKVEAESKVNGVEH
ncbi:hypothetical protein PLICRDRAFT_176460 [Plicaturopsis crispa FD-325 SS-3]|nr:hypothetical protein PLICRDRAFT_176460 [Plicaturopsis crispa FD-325 SS-3]